MWVVFAVLVLLVVFLWYNDSRKAQVFVLVADEAAKLDMEERVRLALLDKKQASNVKVKVVTRGSPEGKDLLFRFALRSDKDSMVKVYPDAKKAMVLPYYTGSAILNDVWPMVNSAGRVASSEFDVTVNDPLTPAKLIAAPIQAVATPVKTTAQAAAQVAQAAASTAQAAASAATKAAATATTAARG